MNKKILTVGGVFVLSIVVIWFSYFKNPVSQTLPTYFTYTPEELESFTSLDSKETIEKSDVFNWDSKMFQLVSNNKYPDSTASRIYAYILVAQNEAASLSFNDKGKYAGSIDAVSSKVACLFFINECPDLVTTSDAYSEAIADIVVKKIETRLAEEDAHAENHVLKIGDDYWSGPQPNVGIETKGWTPWFIKSRDQFRTPSPSFGTTSEAFSDQLALVKKARAEATDAQKQSVVFWAGGPGTKTPPGQWIQIADSYLEKYNSPLQQVLLVRQMVALSVADAAIAVFDSKYFHQIKRPFLLDDSILTVMPTPNHPSYPAGHATLSAAAATILIDAFPESRDELEEMMYEAGNGRTWGGIHFPIDNEMGFILGINVANEALSQQP